MTPTEQDKMSDEERDKFMEGLKRSTGVAPTPPSQDNELSKPLLDPDDPNVCKNCGFAEWRHKQDRPYACQNFELVSDTPNTPKTDGAVVSDELREQVSKVIDGWRYEQDLVASKAEDFPEHKGAGCGCPVCVKMSALNSQATNELIALITADRKRVALEARISELKMWELPENEIQMVFANPCNICGHDYPKLRKAQQDRLSALKAQQEEVK